MPLTPNSLEGIRISDIWLDEKVSQEYRRQPCAQHWARVAKITEETGEAIDALIRWTGQNPRTPTDAGAHHEMLSELADTALTAILAIQHFTKDTAETDGYIGAALVKITGRAMDAGYLPVYPGPETTQMRVSNPEVYTVAPHCRTHPEFRSDCPACVTERETA